MARFCSFASSSLLWGEGGYLILFILSKIVDNWKFDSNSFMFEKRLAILTEFKVNSKLAVEFPPLSLTQGEWLF